MQSVHLQVDAIEQKGKICLLPEHSVSALGKKQSPLTLGEPSQTKPAGPTPMARRGPANPDLYGKSCSV